MALGATSSYPPSLVMQKAAVFRVVLQCWHICSFKGWLGFCGYPCAIYCTLLVTYSTYVPCLLILFVQAVLHNNVGNVASRLFACNSDAFMQVRLNKWLNELEQMFYGMSFAFDKSLTGDEVITGALLRNFYNDDKSKQKAAEILSRYVTRLAIT